ncbi:MAG: right-handed parallel beta-helix repeat-containing protein, partial [Thermoplasmata archaeon]
MLHFHETIYIRGNHDFTRENGVVSGNGTEDDPFIIEKLRIRGNLWNDGIRIENTDKYFVI